MLTTKGKEGYSECEHSIEMVAYTALKQKPFYSIYVEE